VFSYYLQHFADTFRQSVIDLLQGHVDDLSEVEADDPIEQFSRIAQTALVPSTPAPTYLDFGVLGSDLKFATDTIVFARSLPESVIATFALLTFPFVLISVTIWHALRILIVKQQST